MYIQSVLMDRLRADQFNLGLHVGAIVKYIGYIIDTLKYSRRCCGINYEK